PSYYLSEKYLERQHSTRRSSRAVTGGGGGVIWNGAPLDWPVIPPKAGIYIANLWRRAVVGLDCRFRPSTSGGTSSLPKGGNDRSESAQVLQMGSVPGGFRRSLRVPHPRRRCGRAAAR